MPRTPAPGPLDVALSLILHRALPFSPPARHDAIGARLGWGPEPPVSQSEAGARVGVSHQRVAQLERRVLDVLAATGPPPSLLLALELLADRAPCTSAVAALALYTERVTGEVIHPAGVLVAAAAAGAVVPVEMATMAAGRTAVVPVGSSARQSELVAAANRRLAGIGVLRLSRLLEEEGLALSKGGGRGRIPRCPPGRSNRRRAVVAVRPEQHACPAVAAHAGGVRTAADRDVGPRGGQELALPAAG